MNPQKTKSELFFNFELKRNGNFEFDCKGIVVSLFYPILMLVGTFIAIATYPIFIILWTCKIKKKKEEKRNVELNREFEFKGRR